MDYAKTEEFKIEPADKNNGRRIVGVLKRTKNNKLGTGPVIGRTFVLPCTCMAGMLANEKREFAAKMKKDSLCPCTKPCPFQVVKTYLDKCPVTAGRESSFVRNLAARGHRDITNNKMGKGSIVHCIERVKIKNSL